MAVLLMHDLSLWRQSAKASPCPDRCTGSVELGRHA